VTEAEWLASTDPKPMLEFLRGKASERKLRLFACACARLAGEVILNWGRGELDEAASRAGNAVHLETSRRAVDMAEQFADEVAGEIDLAAAARAVSDSVAQLELLLDDHINLRPGNHDSIGRAFRAAGPGGQLRQEVLEQIRLRPGRQRIISLAQAVRMTAASTIADAFESALNAARASSWPFLGGRIFAEWHPPQRWPDADRGLRGQAALLREIVGNPFQTWPSNPAWLRWQDGTVPMLARAIYSDHAFKRLPVLADALEDAGCTDAELLGHLRGPGPHVRGCWALDLLLGRS
jgi:hypothetical protein